MQMEREHQETENRWGQFLFVKKTVIDHHNTGVCQVVTQGQWLPLNFCHFVTLSVGNKGEQKWPESSTTVLFFQKISNLTELLHNKLLFLERYIRASLEHNSTERPTGNHNKMKLSLVRLSEIVFSKNYSCLILRKFSLKKYALAILIRSMSASHISCQLFTLMMIVVAMAMNDVTEDTNPAGPPCSRGLRCPSQTSWRSRRRAAFGVTGEDTHTADGVDHGATVMDVPGIQWNNEFDYSYLLTRDQTRLHK